MGTTIRIRQHRCIMGAAALMMVAGARAQAQYPAYGQPYAPPQQQQLQGAYRPGQTTSAPSSVPGVRTYANTYSSHAQAATQTAARPQYQVAASANPTATGGNSAPLGQAGAPTQQANTTASSSATSGPTAADRYAATYVQPNSAAQSAPAQGSGSAGFITPGTPQYTAMAYRNKVNLSAQSQDLPLSSPQIDLPSPPGEVSGDVTGSAIGVDPYAAAGWSGSAPAADCNCQTGTGYAGNCATGARNYGYGTNAGSYSTYDCYYGTGGYGKHGPLGGRVMHGNRCNRWFGGAYGLLMERDGGPVVDLAFASAGLAAGDYPASSDTVLSTRDVDLGYQGGIEFRLGRTLGGYYDPCGGSGAPCWGLEGVYWTLFSESDYNQYVDGLTLRTYSMIDLRGLEYDPDGAGALPYRPVRHYYDYAPPVNDNTVGATLDDIEVRLARVRSQFEVHNVEVNLLQLAGLSGCAGGCDVAGGATCDTGACATGGACGSRFSCGKFAGFRFMRLDESFMYGVDFENTTTNATGFINHNVRAENDLYGVQLGCNNTYRIGCKWGVHCNAMFGLYGNDMDVRQYMDVPVGGNVRYIQTADNFDVWASKTDVSTIGELRLGASYQYNCNCRIYGGWRLLGVSGVALATDQIPSAFIDPAQVARVNSNGSLLMHGLQAGVEFGY